MKYIIDIDGTICKKENNLDYEDCYPLKKKELKK